MTYIRFQTVKDLFDAFPTARNDIAVEGSEEPSLSFLSRMLNEPSLKPGLAYCAYLLPRREAVWWGCQCLRQLETLKPADTAGIAIAEDWVRDPTEEHRQLALRRAETMDKVAATTWILFATGWAGGVLSPAPGVSVPMAAHSTAQAIRIGLIMGSFQLPEKTRIALQARWLEGGIKLARGEDANTLR
jgi:hypothetical protein